MKKIIFFLAFILLSTLVIGNPSEFSSPQEWGKIMNLRFQDNIFIYKAEKNPHRSIRIAYLYLPFDTVLGIPYISETNFAYSAYDGWISCEVVNDIEIDYTFVKPGQKPDFGMSFTSLIIPKGTKTPISAAGGAVHIEKPADTIIAAAAVGFDEDNPPVICTRKDKSGKIKTNGYFPPFVGGIIAQMQPQPF